MPRTDREDGRRWLKNELIRSGFSEEEACRKVSEFTADHITWSDLWNIKVLVGEIRKRAEQESGEIRKRAEQESEQRILQQVEDWKKGLTQSGFSEDEVEKIFGGIGIYNLKIFLTLFGFRVQTEQRVLQLAEEKIRAAVSILEGLPQSILDSRERDLGPLLRLLRQLGLLEDLDQDRAGAALDHQREGPTLGVVVAPNLDQVSS